MKLYLAANYSDKDFVRLVASILARLGHEIVSDWFYEPTKYNPISDRLSALQTTKEDDAILSHVSAADAAQIAACDALVLFNRAGLARGGCHFEAGLAMGMRKKIFLVGPRTHALLYHERIIKITSLGEIV